jgi:hypothetical protein
MQWKRRRRNCLYCLWRACAVEAWAVEEKCLEITRVAPKAPHGCAIDMEERNYEGRERA